jgi:lactosylceramide 4-alpha-galactosyltransferase
VKELFIQRMENETEAMLDWLTDKVVGVHTWNKISKSQPIYKSSRQDYARLVRDNCPVVFSIAPEIF